MGSKTVARLVLGVLTGAIAMSMLFTTGATAQMRDPYGNGEPTVLPTRIENTGSPEEPGGNPTEEPDVLGERYFDGPGDEQVAGSAEEPQPGVLPFTGGEVTLFVVAGLALLAVGTVLVRRNRLTEKRTS